MNKRVPEVGTPKTSQYNTIQCNNSIEYKTSNSPNSSIVVNNKILNSASPNSIIDIDSIVKKDKEKEYPKPVPPDHSTPVRPSTRISRTGGG